MTSKQRTEEAGAWARIAPENFVNHVQQFDRLIQHVDEMRDTVSQHEGMLRTLSGQVNLAESLLVPEELQQQNSRTEEALRTLEAPLDVVGHFVPSGFMGDWANIDVNTTHIGCVSPADTDDTCVHVNYQPGAQKWAGVYWQWPENNWGNTSGTRIQDAACLVFWAKGETGREVVEFIAGGIQSPNQPYSDSFKVSLGPINLDDDWEEYTIDLSEQDLTQVIGAFGWVVNTNNNPQGLAFYLDSVQYLRKYD